LKKINKEEIGRTLFLLSSLNQKEDMKTDLKIR